MGSAAARHLSEMDLSVALVGPGEPARKDSHTGVFASHYDEARITRRLDSGLDWARLAEASIDRYAALEASGGARFFHPVGSLIVGPEATGSGSFVGPYKQAGDRLGVDYVSLRGSDLRRQFPYFRFPEETLALFEPQAGWINPRLHLAAEIAASKAFCAKVFSKEVVQVTETSREARIELADGTSLAADKVVVACGAFTNAPGILQAPAPMKVYARTVAFLELGEAEAVRLKSMPTLIYLPPGLDRDIYLLPPIRYPDGKIYLKIGGDPKDIELTDVKEAKTWFRGNGSTEVGAQLANHVRVLIPELKVRSISTGSCATSYTESGMPLIYPQSERVTVLTGGNGAAAKCADELGRLGALVATGGEISSEVYGSTFRPEAGSV